jgi:hypothetical protein
MVHATDTKHRQEALMNSHEARAAVNGSAGRQRRTVQAGAMPWPWPIVLILAGAFVAIGLMIDLDIVWPLALVTSGACAVAITEGVKLRRTRLSCSWTALAAICFLGLLTELVVQLVARATGLALPNIWGAAVAALIIVAVSRPVEARIAAMR